MKTLAGIATLILAFPALAATPAQQRNACVIYEGLVEINTVTDTGDTTP